LPVERKITHQQSVITVELQGRKRRGGDGTVRGDNAQNRGLERRRLIRGAPGGRRRRAASGGSPDPRPVLERPNGAEVRVLSKAAEVRYAVRPDVSQVKKNTKGWSMRKENKATLVCEKGGGPVGAGI